MKKENTIMKKVLAMLMAALMVAAMFTPLNYRFQVKCFALSF